MDPEPHEPAPAAPGSSSPEAQAIEQALPQLAVWLRHLLDDISMAILSEARSTAPPEPVAAAPTPAMEPADAGTASEVAAFAAPSPVAETPVLGLPAATARPAADPAGLRTALASLLAHRARAAMVLALPEIAERARITRALVRELDPEGMPEWLEEDAARERVFAAIASPFLRDTLAARIDVGVTLAVRHVLLGGPRPDDADRTPTREETPGMFRRLVAYVLDVSLVLCAGFVVGLIAPATAEFSDAAFTALGYVLAAFGGLVNVQLLATTGTTLGKLSMGIGVVRAVDGSPPDLELAFRREFFGRFLSSVFFGLGSLMAWFHPLRQTWGDRWAGTVVIKLREPVRWRRWAVLTTVTAAVFSLTYLPAAVQFAEVDRQFGVLLEQEGGPLMTLTDSLIQLVTRPVVSRAEMEHDLQAILELAPRVRSQARTIRAQTTRYHRMLRRLAPWNGAIGARIDSVYVLVESCAASSHEFALHMVESKAERSDSLGSRRGSSASQFAASDAVADYDYLKTLGLRLGGEPTPDEK